MPNDIPAVVTALLERYERDRAFLQSGSYGEADTRKELIDPLFQALGWDMANAEGYADAYKDVVHEYSLKIGDTHKAPDYSFRVGGTRKFFLEAKKPGIDITRDADPSYQLRRYAWTAKLPISVLTNFRHLAVYDCTKMPSESDKPSAARTLLIPAAELSDRWDELASLLSKDAVWRGSLDRYATAASRRRGTAEVDGQFLEQMEAWRSALARNFALRNPTLSVEDLNDAVQRTIDRLVFLRIAEDRGIEPYGTLLDAVGEAGAYQRLIQAFENADTRYNSGLFHFKAVRGITAAIDRLTPGLALDDHVARTIVRSMYYPASPYEFSVMPADILGQVYEQFLGKVIRLSDSHRATVEEKPEVRKAGGVYYTPTHVVDYIVDRTLGGALEGKTARQALNVRIVDPSCGSGSFLIAAYDYLVRWFTEAYAQSDADSKRFLYRDARGAWRLTLEQRKKIVTSCLYGVDIDRQAVEVTKLSLLLKILEGESEESLNAQLPMFHMSRVLPDLDRNIVSGNSLVNPEVLDHLILTADEEHALNPFSWSDAFPAAFKSGGFDAVVGNPPYDVLEKERGASSWPHQLLHEYLPFREDLKPVLGGKLNLYRLFLAQSLDVLKDQGHFGMIVPLSLAADISTAPTRRHVFAHLQGALVDCFPQKDNPNRRIFKRAKLSTAVVTGRKKDRSLGTTAAIETRVFPANSFADASLDNTVTLAECELLDAKNSPIPMTDAPQWDVCRRLHDSDRVVQIGREPAFKITRGEINQTVYAGHITADPSHSRLLKGVEVGAFELREELSQGTQEWLDESRFRKDFPSRPYPPEVRIATQRITGVDERQRVVAHVVTEPMYFADSTNSVGLSAPGTYSLDFLCALLNSDTVQWRFRLTSTNNNVGTNELEALPLPRLDFEDPADRGRHDNLAALSQRMVELKGSLRSARSASAVANLERQIEQTLTRINKQVADLYGLSPADIALITDRLARPSSDPEDA